MERTKVNLLNPEASGHFTEVDFLTGRTVVKRIGGSVEDLNNNSLAELQF